MFLKYVVRNLEACPQDRIWPIRGKIEKKLRGIFQIFHDLSSPLDNLAAISTSRRTKVQVTPIVKLRDRIRKLKFHLQNNLVYSASRLELFLTCEGHAYSAQQLEHQYPFEQTFPPSFHTPRWKIILKFSRPRLAFWNIYTGEVASKKMTQSRGHRRSSAFVLVGVFILSLLKMDFVPWEGWRNIVDSLLDAIFKGPVKGSNAVLLDLINWIINYSSF